MAKYIVKRFLLSIVVVLLVVSIVFILLRMMPSDYFFTEEELIKFTDQQKNDKLVRLGLLQACGHCGGDALLDDGSPCPECADNPGYVKRSVFAQMGDFYSALVEYRAFTPTAEKHVTVTVFDAEVYIPKKTYEVKKGKGTAKPKEGMLMIEAYDGKWTLNEDGSKTFPKTKKTVYIPADEDDSTMSGAFFDENGTLFIRKDFRILDDYEEEPEGKTILKVDDAGLTRRLALSIAADEDPSRIIDWVKERDELRDYAVLEEDEEAPENWEVITAEVAGVQRRVAIERKEGDRFAGIGSLNKPIKSVPFFSYWSTRLQGKDPFEGIEMQENSYVRACFNLGESIRLERGKYVTEVIATKMKPSLEIGLISLAISLVLGVSLGVLQAKNHVVDAIGTGYTILVNAVPHLVIYTVIMMLGASLLHLPMQYNLRHPTPGLTKVLPIVCLSVASTAGYMLWTRRYMVDELNKDYIRLARLKGLSERRVMFRHVLKNAFVPLAQYLPYSILLTVGGSLLVETFFGVPGMGPELTKAISRYDLNLVQGIVMLYATMGIFGVFLGDLLMTLIDPRIKLTGKEGVR